MTASRTVIKRSVESQHLVMADNTCFANMLASFTGSGRITAHHSLAESPVREGDELEGHGQEAVIRCIYAMAAKRPYAI
jgi:hypothetical protein